MSLASVSDEIPDTWFAPAECVALWQGDITRLAADAIVNAANSQLLGCVRPFHACIDSAIHWTAGPRLREDCGRGAALMLLMDQSEHLGQSIAYRNDGEASSVGDGCRTA